MLYQRVRNKSKAPDQYPGIGVGKAEYCRDQGVDMVLEDDPLCIGEIKKIALNTQAFLIQ